MSIFESEFRVNNVATVAHYRWNNLDHMQHCMSFLSVFEFNKLAKVLPLGFLVPTPTSKPMRSYHFGTGQHPFGGLTTDIKLSEVAINLGGDCYVNDGGADYNAKFFDSIDMELHT